MDHPFYVIVMYEIILFIYNNILILIKVFGLYF
jgi:hypothetical protein